MIAEFLIATLLMVAGLFGLIGSYGLLKLPDLMTRLHAPTKAATLGVGCLLLASMAEAVRHGGASWHELLITLFLFLTAPVTAMFIAKARIALSAEDLPPTGQPRGWSTLDPGAEKEHGEKHG
ncbi:MAG: Na+/H+ antiporter subunit G [Gemmobacter sp.]|jgi:multicomponent K+:H+ antiporter subunit G|nr:Na+/H+ antiporter subunit G [Gemmobacter sp.]